MKLKLEGTNEEFNVVEYRQLQNDNYICIILAKEWFKGVDVRGFVVTDTDFMVCTFLGLMDGVSNDRFISVGGRQSIAICRREVDAKLLYYNYAEGVENCALGNGCRYMIINHIVFDIIRLITRFIATIEPTAHKRK